MRASPVEGGHVLAVTRYRVPDADAAAFVERARVALATLAGRPGHLEGLLGRAVDDPGLWTLTTRWRSVGDYRRALSSYEVKLHVHPLMHRALDEPTGYELLLVADPGGIAEFAGDRAADADTAGPGDALG